MYLQLQIKKKMCHISVILLLTEIISKNDLEFLTAIRSMDR